MYKIDRNANAISSLEERSFSSLGFRERDHLQEWIAKNPSVLGEELLIIQKEFAGFSDTHERLDLLALDKQGALVIVENKLDDAGRDVTWQALKYASYCSGLTRDGIRTIFQEYLTKTEPGASAEARLLEFFEIDDFQDLRLNQGVTQRLVLVAARFRKEVTSTVLWLMNYGVRLQCFRVTVYSQSEDLFLSVDQIIPTKEAEEYMIGLAVKAQDEVVGAEAQAERHGLRLRFWTRLLAVMNQKNNTFSNISPQRQSWISAGSGMRGIGLNFSATRNYGRAEIYIDRGDHDENKRIFDVLHSNREAVEQATGVEIGWERLDNKRGSRIKLESGEFNVFDEDRWDAMIGYMTDAMVRLERALESQMEYIREIVK